MDLPRNAFRAGLKGGERQIGIWCSIPNALTVEMLAHCGYDWLLLDTEHSPARAEHVLGLLQAAAPYPVSCVVRPAWNDAVEIKKMLDVGAQTLLIPFVQSPEEAARAVAATRYPPAGVRGVSGMVRANRIGAVAGYATRANEEICVLVQVETVEAVARIEEIAAVDGVDGIFIGPADLAASMGFPGQPTHPKVIDAITDATRRIRASGCPAGFLSADPDAARAVAEAGASFLAVDVDLAVLRRGALARREAWRD